MTFNETPIDTTEVLQSSLDIEDRQRTSLFSWNGQFSPQLIESLLAAYAEPGSISYDPFAGSGTVVDESIRRGMGSVAGELNPAAYHMAKIREFSLLDRNDRLAICTEVESELSKLCESDIPCQLKSLFDFSEGPRRDAIALLVILCDLYKSEPSKSLVCNKWDYLKKIICDFPVTDKRVEVVRSDSRRSPFEDGAADIAITSPPYINVMNYHQQYRRSAELLGYPVLEIARSELGANRLNRGNRYLTVIEYAVDMGLAIRESCRVLKRGGRFILVVGRESKVLGNSFCNSEIVWRIASEILGLTPLLRQQRQFKNRFGKMIIEDIIHFENSNSGQRDEALLTKGCALIAKDALTDAMLEGCDSDERLGLLKKAIDRCEE